MRSSNVSMCPYSIVTFERMPSRCAVRWIGEPAIAVALVVTDLLAHALGEHLCAAAGQRIEAGGHQLAQHLLVGHPVEIRKERNLDGREALQVNVRADALEAAQQVRVVAERQVGVQAVDDVDFGERLVRAGAELVPGLLERQRVRALVARLQPRERAEEAAGDTDVRRLDADVVVEVGAAVVPALALAVRERADGEQVARLEEAQPVGRVEPLASLELLGDVGEPGGLDARRARAQSLCPRPDGWRKYDLTRWPDERPLLRAPRSPPVRRPRRCRQPPPPATPAIRPDAILRAQ